MLRVNIYIPKETDNTISLVARSLGKKKAEVTRIALEEGLSRIRPKSLSAQKLLDFAKEAKKISTVGKIPKDIIKNLDFYTWGGKSVNDRIAVVDTDALIALVLEKDSNYEKALKIASYLVKNDVELVFPSTVFPEAITTLVRALNQPQKARLVNKRLQEGMFNIEYIDDSILQRASRIFEESNSKKNTMFDAIVIATAESLNTKTIFSFDSWYPKLGFKLAGP